MVRLIVVASMAFLGCTRSNPNATCATGECMDPAYPYCDVDGAVFGTPGACISVSCTPGEILKCVGDNALTCTTGGDAYEQIACDVGCLDAPTPHCGYIEPRYLPDVCDTPALLPSLTLTGASSVDVNVETTCTGGVVEQIGAPAICVVRYGTITIEADAVVSLPGRWDPPGRAIAFVSDGPLRVDGALDAGAKGKTNGPGASLISSGGQPVPAMSGSGTPGEGGGGAGAQTSGGSGGTDGLTGGAANGGSAVLDPALLDAFVGGAPAWTRERDQDSNNTNGGGGGGGALMLVSCRDSVTVSGTLNAGGGGGPGGNDVFGIPFTGRGGGAGGYIVIQAETITVTGQVFANGGWGGAGRRAGGSTGAAGFDGLMSDTVDVTVPSSLDGEGIGGRGGMRGMPPTNGERITATGAAPGGGGGSMGFVQTYTPANRQPTLTPSRVSPPFQSNHTLVVR
jgi:hypothetical protein